MNKIIKSSLQVLVPVLIFGLTLFFLFRSFDASKEAKKQDMPKDKRIHKDLALGDDYEKNRPFQRAPNGKIQITYMRGDKVLYDQVYNTDEGLFRVPTYQNSNPQYHAIFGGCSFTFGEGISDDETLPSQFAMINPEYDAYNLGFPGGSIGTLLYYAENFRLSKYVQFPEGYFIFTFISNHFDRFFARYNYLTWSSPKNIHYEVIDGKVVNKGFIGDQDFYKNFQKLAGAGLENTVLHTQDPLKWSDEELEKYAVAVAHFRDYYLKEFPRGKFVFVIHPQSSLNADLTSRLMKALAKVRIKTWDPTEDFSRMYKESGETRDTINEDGHPSVVGNKILATWISEKIKTEDQKKK